jgi:CheY-like chemotaxis protein
MTLDHNIAGVPRVIRARCYEILKAVNAAAAPGKRVLIVDDERVLVLDLQRTLRMLGYRVDATAASGEEALRIADAAPPDIVLMDLRLRGRMDGIETALQLRTNHSFGLIYLTGGVDDEQRARAERTTPDAWLAKPYSQAKLQAALEAAESPRCLQPGSGDAPSTK